MSPAHLRLHEGGYIVVDLRRSSAREVSDAYQAFGLLCARQHVKRALLRAGDDDAGHHEALRDVLVTLAKVAAIPLRFRLALVPGSMAIVRVYAMAAQELHEFGCDARLFETEREARAWLLSAETAAPAEMPAALFPPAHA